MINSPRNNYLVRAANGGDGCLACGTRLNRGRRKYCSIDCRQRLRRTLNMRTGLLKALNTRFATFYFTDESILMDVVPYGSKEIFSFIFPRSNRNKPAVDYCRMADMLGNAWWAERRRTNKKYLASQFVFDQARFRDDIVSKVEPLEIRIPSVSDRSLLRLKLGKAVLKSPQIHRIIKSAYRQQALKYHPDRGGNATTFRRIHAAYQQLLQWAENPVFVRRRGFPDKWFYDGTTNRWVQPTPHRALL
jgi:hypothetical protein